ncbi:MAG: M20/M25/M40 family metallo-hydrolase [Phycisphaerales bacterium JB063]
MPTPDHIPIQPALSTHEAGVCDRLRGHVEKLAGEIGIRHDSIPETISATVDYIRDVFNQLGQVVSVETYATPAGEAKNLVVEWPGTTKADQIVIVGAHYDTVRRTPGADDNASAVAMMLEVCQALAGCHFARTVRFVAFANEEPPHFGTPTMGSQVYADRCKERGDAIHTMICLEMVGFYSTAPNSQEYPDELPAMLRPMLPSTGDFIAFVADLATHRQLGTFKRAFKRRTRFPVVAAPLPKAREILWVSDHGPFWDHGYPAIMVTDTSWFRNPHYHAPTDRPETLDYERMARVAEGVIAGVSALAKPKGKD